jgi:energy-coupling factor transporter ATP-binding protein EcfA2
MRGRQAVPFHDRYRNKSFQKQKFIEIVTARKLCEQTIIVLASDMHVVKEYLATVVVAERPSITSEAHGM